MITLRSISAACVSSFRDVRLAALLDAPSAFGSTHAREAALSDADWLQRVGQWQSDRATALLAWDDATPCGIVAAYVDQADASVAHLVSMWVAPTHRHRGIGRLLVGAVLDWADRRSIAVVQLMVTATNDSAQRLYERLGFVATGRSEPHPHAPSLVLVEMSRSSSC